MKRSHLPALDGLRGLAAMWVLIGHVAQNTPLKSHIMWLPLNNSLAVDLFMLLSGFLMFYLHREVERSKPGYFLIRRFFRLAPLYYCCLAIGFAVAPWFAGWSARTWSHAAVDGWSLQTSPESFGLHLSFLFGLSPRYQQSTPLPDWSLSLEAQFYIVFPLAIAFMRRFGARRSSLIMLCIATMMAIVVKYLSIGFAFPSILPFKFHIFIAGMLIAQLVLDGPDGRTALIALAAVLIPLPWWSWRYELTRVMLLFLVYVCTSSTSGRAGLALQNILSHPVLRWAGEMSYGVYLIHLIVMYASFNFLLPILGDYYLPLFFLVTGVTVILSYSIAYVLHLVVEKPGIELGRSVINRTRLKGA